MKKILFLLLLITSISYGQAIAPTRVKITNNVVSPTAPFVGVQENDGFVNKINKSDLIEVLEYASAVNLPVTGVAGKIYVTLDNNRLYRWTGTIYQDLGYVDISNKVDKVTGKSLISDAEITRLASVSNVDISGKENIANKNVANGYAGLGSDGKLISSQLPSITISDTYVVASEVAMLGLTGAEKGDVAVRTDLNKSFILKGNSYSTLADWQELLTPTSAVTTVFGRNGAVTAQTGDYTATMVGLGNVNNTTDLLKPISTATQTALNGKENSFTKNTAFNKNFGNAIGTTAEGNDSRINNGQTAFGWGNHAIAGYALSTGSNINQSSFRTALGLGSNAYTSTSYFQLNTNFGGDVNSGSLNIAGKLFNATNAQESYGSFISFGQNAYTTQINSSPLKNGNTYIRVSGDAGGIGDWRTLWHSGNFNPANYLPLTGGVVTGNVTASGFFNSSDKRLKTILKRDGDVAYFKWKDGRDSKTHIGYIAQEVRKNNPDQVQKGEDKMLSVNYVEILVEKIRMLEKRIEELEKK